MMIMDCISDLHGYYPQLEGGDLLIVAGDLTARHTEKELYDFADWMRNQEYDQMIVIAGNHDTWLADAHILDIKNWVDTGEFEYLEDSGTEFEGLKIWGSPWTHTFPGINPRCTAFTLPENELEDKFALIPNDIDILVSHSPPYGILDQNRLGMPCGSVNLRNIIFSKNKFGKLKLHVFGHIHECGGKEYHLTSSEIRFVNSSHVNESYEPVNKPVRVIL